MMVQCLGWYPGMQKVNVTKLIQENTELTLGKAMEATKNILECETVAFYFVDEERGKRFEEKMIELGVHVRRKETK